MEMVKGYSVEIGAPRSTSMGFGFTALAAGCAAE